MSKLTIQRDPSALDKAIVADLSIYTALGERLHSHAISAIYIAATTGQVGPLNRLYDGLRPNDKQALQNYIRRAHAVNGLDGKNPDGLTSDQIDAAIKAGTVIARRDKKFGIAKGHTSAEAKSLAKLCEDRFINPVDPDKMVFDTNNMAEVRIMGAVDFLDKIIRAGTELDEGDTDRREIHVTEGDRKFIQDLVAKAKQRKNQMALAGNDKTIRIPPHVIKAAKPAKKTSKVTTVN